MHLIKNSIYDIRFLLLLFKGMSKKTSNLIEYWDSGDTDLYTSLWRNMTAQDKYMSDTFRTDLSDLRYVWKQMDCWQQSVVWSSHS